MKQPILALTTSQISLQSDQPFSSNHMAEHEVCRIADRWTVAAHTQRTKPLVANMLGKGQGGKVRGRRGKPSWMEAWVGKPKSMLTRYTPQRFLPCKRPSSRERARRGNTQSQIPCHEK